MSISRHVGFESVAERLLQVTSDDHLTTATDRQYCAVFPDTMCEIVDDSEDEGAGHSYTMFHSNVK